MIEAILWDIDGTLLHGNGIGREATRKAMMQVFGHTGELDQYVFGGNTDFYTLVKLLEPHGHTESTVRTHLPEYGNALAQAMADLSPDYEIRVLPYAMELLTELRQRENLHHGLVTGNMKVSAPVKLSAAGFQFEWFTFGAFGDESMNRDDLPPRAIERVSKLAGRTIAPENVLVIGDTLADIKAARSVGAQVCVVQTGFAEVADLIAAEPDYLIEDLTHFHDTVIL